jgi:SAM-dependent methyltransferase
MQLLQLVKSIPGYRALRRLQRAAKRWGAKNQQWARVVIDRETHDAIQRISPETRRTLEISGDAWRHRASFKDYRSVHYPAFDICGPRLDETFDLIIAEQVFEHLLWPYRAGRNVFEMLAPGGMFLVTTPFLIRIHEEPTDCTRWTETGLKHFLAECGFDLRRIKTGSWGNRACVRANFFDWSMYRPSVHSLNNERDFPVTVWALAEKAPQA